MRKKVLHYINTNELISSGETVVCGISGGPDSVMLGSVLYELAKPLDLSLVFAHVNYGLREEADDDEALVRELAKKCSAPCFVSHASVKKKDEASLRSLRFAFFKEVQKKTDAKSIALGHTADDLVETFLLFLFRGSGLKGLSSIAPKRDAIVRPLLFLKKQEIIDHLNTQNIPFATDKTNQKSMYTRNKIRNDLLPRIKESINPNIVKTLETASKHIALDYDYLQTQAHASLTNVQTRISPHAIELAYGKWKKLHPALQLHVLRLAIQLLKKDLTDIGATHLLAAQKTLGRSKNAQTILLPQGLRIIKKHDRIRLSF
ncbi:tRNA lysidine(34) synthetase TilS [Patescibacteria group bacterium]|nr:tRNA lysidine(34) synthetase TilS [Patescibacteria group bacterium]